jgi:DedD protein
MSDSGFREIQLSGKHVVFLFIAGAVAAVAIFLLGVSVGRGVAKPEAAAQATPVPPSETDVVRPGAIAATTPAPGELQYQEALQGRGDGKAAAATPSPSASPSVSPAASPAKPASTPAASPKTSPKPDAAAPAAGAVKSDAVWYVLVNSFSSRANATKQVEELKSKGITAKINTRSGSGARYQVRVGPSDRATADAMADRLRKEGFKPSVTR